MACLSPNETDSAILRNLMIGLRRANSGMNQLRNRGLEWVHARKAKLLQQKKNGSSSEVDLSASRMLSTFRHGLHVRYQLNYLQLLHILGVHLASFQIHPQKSPHV